jgi:hypothetical protein
MPGRSALRPCPPPSFYHRPVHLRPPGDPRLIPLRRLAGRDLHVPADPVPPQVQPRQRVGNPEPAADPVRRAFSRKARKTDQALRYKPGRLCADSEPGKGADGLAGRGLYTPDRTWVPAQRRTMRGTQSADGTDPDSPAVKDSRVRARERFKEAQRRSRNPWMGNPGIDQIRQTCQRPVWLC